MGGKKVEKLSARDERAKTTIWNRTYINLNKTL